MAEFDEEFDIRPYIKSILQNLWKIAILVVVLAIVGILISVLQQKKFESTASVLLTRSRTVLSLAEQFPTVMEPIDSRSRMDAILSIAQSDAIALETLKALGEDYLSNGTDILEFKKRVKITNKGDVVLITASAKAPSLAAEIANTWAETAVEAINQAYSAEKPLPEIQNQLAVAQQDYETAQANLEAFIEDNQIELLQERVNEAKTLFSTLAEERSQLVIYYQQRMKAMEDITIQAETLKRQLQDGSQSAAGEMGDAIAVLKARALMMHLDFIQPVSNPVSNPISNPVSNSDDPTLPTVITTVLDNQPEIAINLQVDENSAIRDNASSYVADLVGLINTAQEERDKAQKALEDISQDIALGIGNEKIESTASLLRLLEQQLENENSKQLELTSERDLTWDAYQALSEKETEIKNIARASNQVNIANKAIPPQKPISQDLVLNTLIFAIMGLILGVFIVLAAHWWRTAERKGQAS